ncbi:MAG: carbonic anhydrase [Leptothrix sp. (in: b-proteobacteria)]
MNFRLQLKQTAFALSLVLAAIGAHAEGHGPHWQYKGEHNPAHWAELDPAFEACAHGNRQTPIDIRATEKVALPALEFAYSSATPRIVNNGHTVQVNLPAGQTLTVGEQSYELLQFHFHTPSEEAINGKRKPLVAHFVHKNAAGQLGVVAVLFDFGASNAAFAPVFEHLPAKAGETITVEDLTLDLAALLPADKGYYNFEGSLTTPPCSEGVNWMVLKTPVKLSALQIKSFRRIFNSNARPIQPGNGRPIKESL